MSTLSTFWSTLLFIAGGVSICCAAYGLFREKTDTRALLRLMCLGDFGCILLGYAGSAQAETGALLTLVYTGAARLLAWFTLSRLAERAGGGNLAGLRGIGRAEPATAALFAFAMFAAMGISFFFTPDARLILLHASLADGGIFMPALLLAATAMIFYRTAHCVHALWLEGGAYADDAASARPSLLMLALAAGIALAGIFGHRMIVWAAGVTGAVGLPDFSPGLPIAVLIPYLGAPAAAVFLRGNTQLRNLCVCALMAASFLAALFLPAPTPLGHLFAVTATGIGLLAALYSFAYIHRPQDGPAESETLYWLFLPLTFASLAGTALSANLGSMFTYWELMTLASYILVAHERTQKALDAARKYLIMCGLGAVFLPAGLFLFAQTAGSADSAALSAAAYPSGIAVIAGLLCLLGFGVKAGLVPGHGWLPDAHPAAPSSISAPLSGVLTKAGIFGLAFVLIGVLGLGLPDKSGSSLGVFVSFLGLATMLYGEIAALFQKDIKRLFAYSTLGQIGEITLTLGLCTLPALAGSLLHLVNHAVMKDLLFFCSGALILRAGGRNLEDLRGLGRAMPFTACCMVVGLLSILGLPPFAGFMSKFLMVYALAAESPLLAGVFLLGSLAGCVYYVRVIRTLIFEPYEGPAVAEAPLSMRLPLAILAGLCVVLGLFPELGLSLVRPVLESWTSTGKLAAAALPSLSYTLPPYTLVLLLAAALPVWFRKQPETAGKVTALAFAAAALLVVAFGRGLDTLSFGFALLVPVMGGLNAWYSVGYMNHSHTQWRFHTFFLLMCAGLTGVAAAPDLFSFFFFWEIMSSWSLYFVIVHEENPAALREGFKYFFFNVLGAAFLFLAVALALRWCGGGDFAAVRAALPSLSGSQAGLLATLAVIGLVMKAAQLPFRIDIQMHPATAPTPVSGYISSVLLKSALFGLVKLFLVLGGGTALVSGLTSTAGAAPGLAPLMDIVVWVGAVTIVMAAGFAVFQKDLKLVLIYSTVSQLGYMVAGVGLGSSLGIAGGLLHLVNHMFFKDLLFLTAGAIIVQTHRQNMDEMGGLARNMPVTLAFFCIGAACVIGIPPSNGFTSKWILYHALMEQGHVLPAVLSLAGSVITLAYFAKALHSAFLGRPAPDLEHVTEAPKVMLLPMGVLAGLCLLTSLFPGLILYPLNRVLAEYGLPVLDVALYGLASGRGAWNAVIASSLFGAAGCAGWFGLKMLIRSSRTTPVHTCGVDPADLQLHTASRDIYTAPARELSRIGDLFNRRDKK